MAYTNWMHANPKLQPLGWIYTGLTVKDYLNFNQGKADDITGIKVIDPLTFEFTLDSPDASFPRTFLTSDRSQSCRSTTWRRCPKRQRFNNKDPYWYTNPVGTGPYKFVQYVEDQYIEYARNDDWWGGKVGPEKLFMKIIVARSRHDRLEKGEIDYMYPTNLTEIKRLPDQPEHRAGRGQEPRPVVRLDPQLQTMNGAWRDPKVKQALLKSVDRQGYVKTILQGYGAVRNSPFDGTAYACPTHDRVELRPGWRPTSCGPRPAGPRTSAAPGSWTSCPGWATSLVSTICPSCRKPCASWASRPTST